jgi:hypothetical protein
MRPALLDKRLAYALNPYELIDRHAGKPGFPQR